MPYEFHVIRTDKGRTFYGIFSTIVMDYHVVAPDLDTLAEKYAGLKNISVEDARKIIEELSRRVDAEVEAEEVDDRTLRVKIPAYVVDPTHLLRYV